jgi:nucleoside-diphosphate-sugar epimerase
MRLFCFGFGYSAENLLRRLSPRDLSFAGTRTNTPSSERGEIAIYKGDAPSPEVRALLTGSTHILVSIPPDLEGDVVLRHYRQEIAALPGLLWIGYLSTVGVYGDHKGAWVDEESAVMPIAERSLRRLQAERAWLKFGAETGRRVETFRLSGIYGPGRSVIDGLRAGSARRILKPGQVFNRIHVDDISRVLAAAIDKDCGYGIYNVSDDEPAAPEEVIAYAAELLGLPVPPAVPFEQAGLTGMAASFWAENKRVRNTRIRKNLGVDLLYPTYREGLRALAAT